MHPSFQQYAEALHPSYERLIAMPPISIENLPTPVSKLPSSCIYLFSEGGRHLYTGRTRRFRQRLRQHSIPASQHNQAVFAFRIAREVTGRLEATYNAADGSRVALSMDPLFSDAFTKAKVRIRKMALRYVEEPDPLRQALLEIYVSIVLKTPYNDFNTH